MIKNIQLKFLIFTFIYYILYIIFGNRVLISGDEQFYLEISELIYDQTINDNYLSRVINIYYLSLVHTQNFSWIFFLALLKNAPGFLFVMRFIFLFLAFNSVASLYKFNLYQFTALLLFASPVFYYSFSLLRDDLLISFVLIILMGKQRKICTWLLIILLLSFRFYWGIFVALIILLKNFDNEISLFKIFKFCIVSIALLYLFPFDISKYLDLGNLLLFPFRLLFAPFPWQIESSIAGIYENKFLYSINFFFKLIILVYVVHSFFRSDKIRYRRLGLHELLLFIFCILQFSTILNGPRQIIVFQILIYSFFIYSFKIFKNFGSSGRLDDSHAKTRNLD